MVREGDTLTMTCVCSHDVASQIKQTALPCNFMVERKDCHVVYMVNKLTSLHMHNCKADQVFYRTGSVGLIFLMAMATALTASTWQSSAALVKFAGSR